VSLSVTHQGSLPVAYRLFLPKACPCEGRGCGPTIRPAGRSGVPDDVRFQTKPEIALPQLRQAVANGVPPGVALDPAYDNDSKLRARISELGLSYVAGTLPTTQDAGLGFHHHATLCVTAYGFLISEKETIPPSVSACARLAIWPSRRLSTQRICRCDHNAMCRIPSPRRASASRARWSCHSASVAARRRYRTSSRTSDAVGQGT
jgi:DDE superfamily endonuclease